MSNYCQQKTQEAIRILLLEARSRREISRMVGVAPGTVTRYSRIMDLSGVLCACGKPSKHRGWCKVRFSRSPVRQEYMKRHWAAQATPDWVRNLAKQHPSVPDITECYPYIALSKEDRFMLAVDEAVPKDIRNDTRADICQDILVALLSGEIAEDEIPSHVPRFVKQYRKMFGWANLISFDAEDEDGQTLCGKFNSVHDNLPDQLAIAHEEWDEEQKYRLFHRNRVRESYEEKREREYHSLGGFKLAEAWARK